MYYTANIIVGILISFLIFLNGALSKVVGNFTALVIAHVIGFFLISIVSLVSKSKATKYPKEFYLYLGGVFNIFNFFIQNITMQKIGVSGTVIFIIVGQMLSSLIIDHFGLLGRKIHKIEKKKFISIGLILFGAILINLA